MWLKALAQKMDSSDGCSSFEGLLHTYMGMWEGGNNDAVYEAYIQQTDMKWFNLYSEVCETGGIPSPRTLHHLWCFPGETRVFDAEILQKDFEVADAVKKFKPSIMCSPAEWANEPTAIHLPFMGQINDRLRLRPWVCLGQTQPTSWFCRVHQTESSKWEHPRRRWIWFH